MKSLSKLALCLLLAMSLTVSAFAAQVPDSLVAENLNGQQRLVKTYTLSPEVDPDELKEEDFSYDGYLYTWAYTTKVEHPYLESKTVTETVTVNTAKNDLAQILAELSPSMPYEKDGFSGELALDHTTLSTEASGYTTKYSKTTETKVIGNLDRNDMSYVPATTVKNGKTLTLANVEWQGHRHGARRRGAGSRPVSGGRHLFRLQQLSGCHRLCHHGGISRNRYFGRRGQHHLYRGLHRK